MVKKDKYIAKINNDNAIFSEEIIQLKTQLVSHKHNIYFYKCYTIFICTKLQSLCNWVITRK